MDSGHRPQQLKLPLVPMAETIDVWTAARLAEVSQESIRRWCDEGRITAYKLVGRWRIDREAFYAFLYRCGARSTK